MLIYLPSPKNVGLLDYYCNQNGTPIVKHDTTSLSQFIEIGMTNLSHVTTLVIDLAALTDTDDELIMAIQSYKMLYSGARIAVVALGRSPGDELLDRLVREGVTNIITGMGGDNQQKEIALCLSDSGMTFKEASQYLNAPLEGSPPKKGFSLPSLRLPTKPQQRPHKGKEPRRAVPVPTPPPPTPSIQGLDALPLQPEPAFIQAVPGTQTPQILSGKPVPACHKRKQTVTVGICGTQRRVGTTHQALMLCGFAVAFGLRGAYMEANAHNMTGYVREYYNTNTNQGMGLTQFGGVDMFSGYSLPLVMALDYDLYVFDYGTVDEVSEKDYLSNDIKIVVGGSKAWELPFYPGLFKRYADYPSLHFILSFTPQDEAEDIVCLMGKYGGTTYFSGYSPSPFESGVNDKVYSAILHDYIQITGEGMV